MGRVSDILLVTGKDLTSDGSLPVELLRFPSEMTLLSDRGGREGLAVTSVATKLLLTVRLAVEFEELLLSVKLGDFT